MLLCTHHVCAVLAMYIAGESYAGVYVPMLVKEILSHQIETPMNLQGYVLLVRSHNSIPAVQK